MTKIRPLIFCLLIISFSCLNKNEKNDINADLTFGDFVELEQLDNVEMSNTSGTFDLNEKQIEKIKGELSKMIYVPNSSAKVGAITIELLIDGETHTISSASHGDYIEVHSDIVTKNRSSLQTSDWLYFKTGEINFDNYKNENQ